MNVAIIPNTTIPVSIMSVNVQTNKTYFVVNSYVTPPGVSAKAAEMNGMTVEMSTRPYQVTAGTTYHLKLGIADGRCLESPPSICGCCIPASLLAAGVTLVPGKRLLLT